MIAPETVPRELLDADQWVTWGYEDRDGKPTKVPYNPRTGYKASSIDRKAWGSYEESRDAEEANPELEGVGFVFTEDDTFAGVDLDDCRDPGTGKLDPEARAIVDQLDSYTEVSPSGTGVKVFCRASKPGAACSTLDTPWGSKLEMYDWGRFFAVTGDHLEGTPTRVKDSPRAFKALHGDYLGVSGQDSGESEGYEEWSNGFTDDQAIAAASGPKFLKLYRDGDASDYATTGRPDGDRSKADYALLGWIADATGPDPEQIERIARSSAMLRGKWDDQRSGKSLLRYSIDNLLSERHNNGHRYDTKGTNFVSDQYSIPPKKKEIEFLSVADVLAASGDDPPWLVKPFLVRGGITDLAGRAKAAGKTSFTLGMVRCCLDGKPFLGEDTEQASVVFLTEQGNNIAEAFKKTGINERHENLHIVPWRSTTGHKWPQIVEAVRGKIEEVRANGLPIILVVDTLNRFAGLDGEKENSAGDVMAAMNPLMELAQDQGAAVLTIRHANKEGAARGSTAFDHDADILLTMGRPLGGYDANVRELKGMGRYDDVPELLLVELNEDGYKTVGTSANAAFKQAVSTLKEVAPDNAGDAMRETDLLDAMTEHEPATNRTTARRAIKFLQNEGALFRVGKGVRNDPYLLYIPAPMSPDELSQILPGKGGRESDKSFLTNRGGPNGQKENRNDETGENSDFKPDSLNMVSDQAKTAGQKEKQENPPRVEDDDGPAEFH